MYGNNAIEDRRQSLRRERTSSNREITRHRYYAAMARTVVQATLEEIESPFKTLEDTEVDTETVIDDSVTGIETPLDTITIASQDGRESNQEDSSSQDDSTTPPLGKGKTKVNKP